MSQFAEGSVACLNSLKESCVQVNVSAELQALVYHIPPPATAILGYTIGPATAIIGYAIGPATAILGYTIGPATAIIGYAIGPATAITGYAIGPATAILGYTKGLKKLSANRRLFVGAQILNGSKFVTDNSRYM